MLTNRILNRLWYLPTLFMFAQRQVLQTGTYSKLTQHKVVIKFQLNETQLRFAGHNKWSKIARKKLVADMQRSNMISRHVTRIRKHVAKNGNSEHPELIDLMDRGKELQIPKATLERALTISLAKSFKEHKVVLRGPSNYLVLVCIYGSPSIINQSRSELKKISRKHSLTILQAGSDSSFFLEKGIIDVVIPDSTAIDIEEFAIEIGAENCSIQKDESDTEFWQFKTDLESYQFASKLIREKKFIIIEQRTEFFPRLHSQLTADQFEETAQVLDKLNGIEDVTGVFDNISCKELDIQGSAIAY